MNIPIEYCFRTENSWDKLKENCFKAHLPESSTEWSLRLKDKRLQ